MATRSAIAIKQEDGKVKSVYCHSDGYPEHNGKLLLNFYNSDESANEIVNLGGISFLDEKLSPEKEFSAPRYDWRQKEDVKHSFETPQKGITTFYHRDRGEELDILTHDNETEFIKYWRNDVDYLYIRKDEKWFVDGKELTEEMTKEDS